MPNWRDEYASSLRDSELQNPVNMELVQACSQMADRISALEAEKAALESQLSVVPEKPQALPPPTAHPPRTSSSDPPTISIAQFRLDLAEALRSKGSTESRLLNAEQELARIRARAKLDAKSIREMRSERSSLATKLNDREYELREKRKLVEQVQDEMITLNLQLSLAEKERDKVRRENKELIDRWMKRMEQEADAMNLANEPRPTTKHR